MPDYEGLKQELAEIADILQNFDADLQPAVFRLLINEYYEGDLPIPIDQSPSTASSIPEVADVNTDDREVASQTTDDSSAETSSRSFDDYIKDKDCNTHQKKCLVSVYYTTKVLGKSEVSDEDVEKRYVDARWKLPARLRQTLIDIKNNKDWIESTENGNWEITYKGEMEFEHELTNNDS